MCELERVLLHNEPSYNAACLRYTVSEPCCRTWSLYNYVLLLNNVTNPADSCDLVTVTHIRYVTQLLNTCAHYYHDMKLVSDCADGIDEDRNHCAETPPECRTHNAVYNILHYLTDAEYMTPQSTEIKLAMTVLPVATGQGSRELYSAISGKPLMHDVMEVVAVNFGIKQQLFRDTMHGDMIWFLLALVVVYACVWLYTRSLFLTIVGVATIAMTTVISYFIYTTIFNIHFFPFINLLALLLLIAIGADDLFIYVREWRLAKFEKNVGTYEKVVSDTLHRSTLSMCVTSFTTSAALYANYVSTITAVQCFALYSGTAVIVNFALMVTFVPALVVIQDKWFNDCFVCYSANGYSSRKGIHYYICKIPHSVYNAFCDWSRGFFDKIVPCLVIRLRYLWFVLFTAATITSMIVVLYKPRLRLPTSNEFQVFSRSHLFEVYDFDVKDKFWFEKSSSASRVTMPLTVVWGVKATDSGDRMDPASAGGIRYDPSFNVTTPQAQAWLLAFCRSLRRTEYYKPSSGQ